MTEISTPRQLHRLIYVSRQRAEPPVTEEQVDEIIRASIRRNREAAITGLLLVHDGWFLQVLEGPAQEVMTTYGRIDRDPRHHQCRVLAAGPAPAREFGDWNMCARRMSKADEAILDALSRRQALDLGAVDAPSALRLLKAVRGIQQRAG